MFCTWDGYIRLTTIQIRMYVKPLGTHVKHPTTSILHAIPYENKQTTHKPALVTTNYTYNTTKSQRIYVIGPSDPTILILSSFFFNIRVSVHHKSIIYNKPTGCNSDSIVFIKNYKYALHVSDALCVHHQEHYKL